MIWQAVLLWRLKAARLSEADTLHFPRQTGMHFALAPLVPCDTKSAVFAGSLSLGLVAIAPFAVFSPYGRASRNHDRFRWPASRRCLSGQHSPNRRQPRAAQRAAGSGHSAGFRQRSFQAIRRRSLGSGRALPDPGGADLVATPERPSVVPAAQGSCSKRQFARLYASKRPSRRSPSYGSNSPAFVSACSSNRGRSSSSRHRSSISFRAACVNCSRYFSKLP